MNTLSKLNLVNENESIMRYKFNDYPNHTLVLGKGSYIGPSIMHLGGGRKGNISIGNYTSIAVDCVFIMGMNHDYSNVSTYPFEDFLLDNGATNHYTNRNHYQIIIGHDVWVGQNVTIMGGVKIGNGAVIAANSLVVHDVPPYSIVGGVPAKLIKYRFKDSIIRKLSEIKWWYWDKNYILKNLEVMKKPEVFISKYHKKNGVVKTEEIVHNIGIGKKIILFLANIEEGDGVSEDVIRQYVAFSKKNKEYKLLLGIDNKYAKENKNKTVESDMEGERIYFKYYDIDDCCKEILSSCSFIISSDTREFMKYYDYSLDYNIGVLNGFDENIFHGVQ